jgi:transposase
MKLISVILPPQTAPRSKFVVTLTAEERHDLEQLTRTGRGKARTLAHARILLKADAGPTGPNWTAADIAAALDVSLDTIARVRRAFVEDGLEAALHRRPSRTPRLRTLDGRAEAHLIALACSAPPDGAVRWTMQLLTEHFAGLGVSPPVSDETVRRTLKQTRSSRG